MRIPLLILYLLYTMYYLPRTSRGTLGQPAHAKKRTRTLILAHDPAFLETLTAFSTQKKGLGFLLLF